MTFERLWPLLLLPLPVAWAAYEWRRSRRPLGIVLKALSFLALLAALAEPRLNTVETKVGVAVLVDTSASLAPADLERATEVAVSLERARGRHWLGVMPFARGLRDLSASELAPAWRLQTAPGESGRATDIEAAIRDGISSIPAGLVPRLVLITDGKENRGSAARAAWQARQIGVPIDTYAVAGRPRPDLRLESVSLPPQAFAGERFALDLTVTSPRAASATVELAAEGKPLGSPGVQLDAGANLVRVHTAIASGGVVELTGAIRAEGLGEVRFAQAVALRRPRLLFLTQDPAGTESHLLSTLASAQFDIVAARDWPAQSWQDFQIIVLNNWDLEAIAPARKSALELFVQQGGGLLVIGGERNIYVENKKREEEDPLERALPAKLAPPRSPEGTCLVLIVDKSSSMEGKKMELARQAAIGVIENLRPIDMVGVLIFDNSFQWAVPIRKAEDRSMIKRLVAGITPDGGTQIAPALAEAYRRILPIQATFKHVVLLTDGISEEGDSLALAKEAASQRVTISTVGLGQDVNRAYLEKVAAFAKGRSYFLVDPSGLEQVLLRDVMEHTGSTAIEKPLSPIVLKQAEVIAGVGMESAPPLRGYVRFLPKPSADMILAIEKADPLYIRWQYGLGRSAVFASDAKARWAADWVGWPGFDRFWANLVRDLLPHTQPVRASLHFDSAAGLLVADYRLAESVVVPARLPELYVVGPEGFRRPLPVRKVAPLAYRGAVTIGDRRGLFRVRPLEESRAFPEIGFYRQEEELSDWGSDPDLLKRIARFTGGRFEPAPTRVFDSGGRTTPTSINLWPALLALAIVANIAELVHRKWPALTEFFRRAPRAAPAA